ncbi:hypothetical protein L3Y34_014868 [Caenorhabditis briggsae]|uniref:Nucleoporin Nup159/Nup146 N-terminal domain-containing protein n=1 Tax=Caenorhabditis briggsae TaxID=6238 RepID=A0AAE9IYZ3_CAEBR|nr:hypothetical protein L3Y34_014868 [Caenorhabditis briggsae]
MATDEVAQDVSQVTDFYYHTCRKFRIFSEKVDTVPAGKTIRNRLATSSQLGVTFALVGTNQLLCFPTKSLLSYKVTRENMIVEVTDLSAKSIGLHGVEEINDMGVNSDGTLLAVLQTRNNDVSVDVFDIKSLCSAVSSVPFKPICSTRVGTEQVNQGSCFEWNPAFPDTFAASSTDRSIMVAKIDVKNPSSQKLIGIGKLGAITTAISWSPKGKQLTIGDSLGKIVQLKPELDVVRSQAGPKHTPAYGKVTGLCWLATTEWLVSFERGTDHDAYLMRCKKDKPTEWMQYHELSYSSSKWTFPAFLFPASQLLVDWNVVIVGNSKTSEIATVGKRDEWQTWVPVEGEGIYLPTTASGKDTVPIGLTIDRSMAEEVSLEQDGSRKHRPSPLVLCLTNDGVLTVHHVISTVTAHKLCQIESQSIGVTGLAKLQLTQAVSTSSNASSASPAQIPTAQPSTIFEQKPKLESVAPTPKSNIFGTPLSTPKPADALLGSTPTTALGSTPTASMLFGGSKISPPANTAAPEATPTTPAPQSKLVPVTTLTPASSTAEDLKALENKNAEALAAKKKILLDRVSKINLMMTSTKDSIMKMSFAVGKMKNCVMECAEVVQASLEDSKEVMDELRNLIVLIERMSDRTQHTVKEMDFEIDEKMELVAGVDDGERVLEKLRSMSETEKMMRFNKLETTADLLNGKYEECCEKIKKLRTNLAEKESLRKQAVLPPFRYNSNLNQLRHGAESEIALKVMRNVTKIILDTRERIQRTELDFVRFKREISKGPDMKKNANATLAQPSEICIPAENAPQRGKMSDSEIVKARQLLVSRVQKKGPVKTRNVIIESYKKADDPKTKKLEELDTSNLSNAILKLSMTPRRVIPTSSLFTTADVTPPRKADAATQADEPPVVKTVVVTVESPAKPVTTAPVTSLPKTTKTTAVPAIATPKVATMKEEVKDQKTPAPLSTSSSIFSGSLFGSTAPKAPPVSAGTSPLPTAGSSSLLNSSLNISPKEEKEGITEANKNEETKLPNVKKVEEKQQESDDVKVPTGKVETPKEEPVVKQEQPKPVEPVNVTPKVEAPAPTVTTSPPATEPKTDLTPKAPSFSFNSTPKSITSTPSIFGGEFGTQSPASTNSSSIFGGAATATPVASGNTSSIFGGGAKTTNSPFGSFGKGSAQPAQAQNLTPATSSVSFSFNTGSSAPPAKSTGFGAFGGGAPAQTSSAFGSSVTAPTVPNVDDGMEDDSMVNGGGPGGFMSGLGSSGNAISSNTGNNPFAPKASTGTASNNSWLFGGGNAQQPSQQQQKPSFSFSTGGASQQPATSTTSSSVFGGAPKFGSQPVFGAKPFGGGAAPASGLSKNASIFGGAVSSTPSAPAGGGFAQFATGQQTSSLFGGGAAAAAPQTGSSIFGGGAKTTAPASSIFGGGASTNANKNTSFTSWR